MVGEIGGLGGEKKGVCTSPHRFEQEDVSYERIFVWRE
jgi:hypothetical protein